MTGLVLPDTRFISFIKSLVKYSKTFDSSYDTPFAEGPISDLCKDIVFFEFPQEAVDATCRLHVHEPRLKRRYPETLQLIEKVNDEAAANDSAARKSALGIKHLESVLLLESKKQDALVSIAAAAAHTRDSTRVRKTAALCSSCFFYSFSAALQDNLKIVHKKAFPAAELTFEMLLSAQEPRKKTSSLFVEATFLSTISLLSLSIMPCSADTFKGCARQSAGCN